MARKAVSGRLDERTIISRYFLREPGGDVVLGVGDDAAVTTVPRGMQLVTAMDTIVEAVHFPRGIDARSIGHRALAVNLSDLAAMGARPLWATLSLSLPEARAAWVRRFAAGFFALARRHDVRLVGGDTVRGPLVVTVTAMGCIRPGRCITRDGARPADDVYVSGTPGDAVAGRLSLSHGARGALARRFLYPEPRVALGRALAGRATAMIDVSDGLHDDLAKLARASGVGLELDANRLPLSAALLREAGGHHARLHALTGGDDYELAFTAPRRAARAIASAAASAGCRVTRIGEVVPKGGVRWKLDDRRFRFRDETYRHFA